MAWCSTSCSGFNAVDPAGMVRDAWARVNALESDPPAEPAIQFSVVAHAPYSVSPALFSGHRQSSPAPHRVAMHLGESAEEIEFLRTGRGPIRTLLEELGVWTDEWPAPGATRCGTWRTWAICSGHAGGARRAPDRRRRSINCGGRARCIVTCPRSNLWVGAGPPRLAHFYGARLTWRSARTAWRPSRTLNLFDELAEMRRLAPEITAADAARQRHARRRRRARLRPRLRHDRAGEARGAWSRWTCRPPSAMWKNIWSAACRPDAIRRVA